MDKQYGRAGGANRQRGERGFDALARQRVVAIQLVNRRFQKRSTVFGADDKPGMGEVRASGSVPIASGESEATRFAFRDLAVLKAVDVFQPDPAFCGGITESMRIAALASAFNLRLSPHLWAGAPCFFAGLHICAASPASFVIEYSLGANPMIHDLVEEEVSVNDGMIAIPDRPGLGFTIAEKFLEAHACRS